MSLLLSGLIYFYIHYFERISFQTTNCTSFTNLYSHGSLGGGKNKIK